MVFHDISIGIMPEMDLPIPFDPQSKSSVLIDYHYGIALPAQMPVQDIGLVSGCRPFAEITFWNICFRFRDSSRSVPKKWQCSGALTDSVWLL
jgi:hypothetical protein